MDLEEVLGEFVRDYHLLGPSPKKESITKEELERQLWEVLSKWKVRRIIISITDHNHKKLEGFRSIKARILMRWLTDPLEVSQVAYSIVQAWRVDPRCFSGDGAEFVF